jgi:hypothetical protein
VPGRGKKTERGSRPASRKIATICSSVNRDLRMLPSFKEGSLSTNQLNCPDFIGGGFV